MTEARNCGGCNHLGPERHASGLRSCDLLPPYVFRWAESQCRFTPVRWVPLDARKLARREAQAAIEQAASAAERALEGWGDIADAYIKAFAEQAGKSRFTGHDIVVASQAAGIVQPPNSKAWGSPIQRAVRAKVIFKVGYTEDENRHNAPVPLFANEPAEVTA